MSPKAKDSLLLLVDDTPTNLHLLTHVLAKEGYSFLEATNGEKALELAREHNPDLILLDIIMPEMNGFEVIKELKRNEDLEDIPVIFLSSLSESKDIVEAFKHGGVDYITKPIQKAETLARIKTHLHIRFLQKQLNQRIQTLQEREQTLSMLNREKDELVRTVSHDIKNPLTGIIGLVKLMRSSLEISDEEQQHMLSVIEESGVNLLNLALEVLDTESRNRNAGQLNYSQIAVSELIKRVISINLAKATAKEINLAYLLDPKDITMLADRKKIEIVVNNIVSNALKFTPSGGKVWIEVKENQQEVLITVRDTGIGIPEDKLPLLFENTKKISRKGTDGETGTGLGLNIVRIYVELHNGKIWAESEVNKGTTFFIKLPINKN